MITKSLKNKKMPADLNNKMILKGNWT